MTPDLARRWCVSTAAALSVLTVLTGCSGSVGSSPASNTSTSTSHRPPATPVGGAADAAALAALSRAEQVTRALHSYSFSATQRLSGGATAQQTLLTGRAVRPGAVSYDVSVAGKHQLVIKVGGRTFVRVPPAAWKALTKPGPTVDPVASLVPLLTGLTDPTLTARTLRGTVASGVLTAAGLAPAGAPSTARSAVTFTLDAAGHVTSVSLSLKVKAGTQTLTLDELTTFNQFNTAPAIKAPGTVK